MNKLKKLEKFIIILNIIISISFISLLVIGKWPNWWEYVILERSPMTWFESMLLWSCFMLCGGCLLFSILREEKSKSILWIILVLGFAFLTLDERFALHERIRDGFLAPKGIKIPLFFWTSAGDFILLVFMVIGLLMLPKILKLFRERKTALIFFIIGIFFAVTAILMDSLNVHEMSIEFLRVEQFIEEIFETTGMLFFLNSLFLLFTDYFRKTFQMSVTTSEEKYN
ncbi:hypothetical protein [Oceanirhabdus seepicola]|uniref:Uncharacterized protein n=1 Tax=Oceanirhabdus seepicola TaxID=2828781 RepID=A0A9J6NYC6_9CLOT|nr:hypothetical protein [Oceanirhabdus seepicola]MCM1988990.1 hypothetical protein [Oceanirhabdus seepicola]